MKYRLGFVSNSSSSSFIITNSDNINKAMKLIQGTGYDYYVLNDKLYTSDVSDSTVVWNELYDLTTEDKNLEEFEKNTIYWLPIEGELGCDTVYVPREEFINNINYSKNDKLANEVLVEVQQFIKRHDIFCEECIYDNDTIAEESLEFIERLCDIVGYTEEDEQW